MSDMTRRNPRHDDSQPSLPFPNEDPLSAETFFALCSLLSLPAVDSVVTGPATLDEWNDGAAAYEAGPLRLPLCDALWAVAAQAEECAPCG